MTDLKDYPKRDAPMRAIWAVLLAGALIFVGTQAFHACQQKRAREAADEIVIYLK